jgi:hypothetical protein
MSHALPRKQRLCVWACLGTMYYQIIGAGTIKKTKRKKLKQGIDELFGVK